MERNHFELRPMAQEDLSEVITIQADAYASDFHESYSVIEGRLLLFPKGCWVAVRNNTTLGYLLSHPWNGSTTPKLDSEILQLPSAPNCYYIHDLAISSAARGLGIARGLVEQAFRTAEELGFTNLRLVAVQNSDSLWGKFGFRAAPEGEAMPSGYGDNALVMTATLPEEQHLLKGSESQSRAMVDVIVNRVRVSRLYDGDNPLVKERLQKVAQLRTAGIDPYPAVAFKPTHTIPEIRCNDESLIETSAQVRIAGRVVSHRKMGKVTFLDLLDDGARLQVFAHRPTIGDEQWNILELVDLGDFVGVDGDIFRTRTGELSIRAQCLSVLGKATHPMPLPKMQGERIFEAVTDKGTLYRHRHIDLVCNTTSRHRFIERSRIVRGIRRYLDEEGFIEVETPILGRNYGGAAARPFTTEVNALDQHMFLRISPECGLKRLMCGGINKVYEIGKNFRNEGIDSSHNPEFTMVEWYEAYSDYFQQMVRFENLVSHLCEEVNGSTQIMYRSRPLDLTPPWRRLPIHEGLLEFAGLDIRTATDEEMPEIFRQYHPDGIDALPDPLTWGAAVVELFEALVEPSLWNPVFVMDHPIEVSPLTKRHRNDPRLVERFEPMIAGMEVGNSYSELNDPVEQYNRLVSQQVARDDEYDLDEDFLQAVAQGMPPAGGTGLGVDRIVMVLTNAESIRDVVFFPFTSR